MYLLAKAQKNDQHDTAIAAHLGSSSSSSTTTPTAQTNKCISPPLSLPPSPVQQHNTTRPTPLETLFRPSPLSRPSARPCISHRAVILPWRCSPAVGVTNRPWEMRGEMPSTLSARESYIELHGCAALVCTTKAARYIHTRTDPCWTTKTDKTKSRRLTI